MPESGRPKMLWHYTDVHGLLGILQSKQLWASSAVYLNDEQELDYGHFCLREGLSKVANELNRCQPHPKANNSSLPGDFLQWKRAELEGDIPHLHGNTIPEPPEVYIVSFCEEGDLLSQWQGYSEGSGYALGFDSDELIKSLKQTGTGLRLEKVQYGENGVNMYSDLIKSEISKKGSMPPDLNDKDIRRLLKEAGRCKHPAFRAEQEWRIISDGSQDVEVRTRSNALLPFVKVDFSRAALNEVRIGPGGNRILREKALRRALEANQLRVFELDLSGFRDREIFISDMGTIKDINGDDQFTVQDIEKALADLKHDQAIEIAKAESKADVRISRSDAPYRT